MTNLATEVGDIIQALVNRGFDRIVVPNLPDIGAIPRFVGSAEAADKRTTTIAYNEALAAELALQNTDSRVTIYQLDIFTLFDQMLFYAADYGFTDVSNRLDQASGNPEPSTYAFWDDIHPTTRSHDLIHRAARAVVDTSAPIELISQSIEPDLSLRQTWLANPDLTYEVRSGTDLRHLSRTASYTDSPAHTIVVPAPGPQSGFYQTRVIP